jgi:hypothetical protein
MTGFKTRKVETGRLAHQSILFFGMDDMMQVSQES